MRITIFILLAIAILAAAGPPTSSKSNKGNANQNSKGTGNNSNKRLKQPQKETTNKGNSTELIGKVNATELNETASDLENDQQPANITGDYCYDSSWSFKCRQTSPNEYELECKIANADGDPCFPNLANMIEAASPLSTISFPILSSQAQAAATNIQSFAANINAENVEGISLQAPFKQIPANAFAGLPHLRNIVLESLDGVKAINIDRQAFANCSAKNLHLIGYDVGHIMNQNIDCHNFESITFSDVAIDCTCNQNNASSANPGCGTVFNNIKSVQTLNVESIYVYGNNMNTQVFQPLSNSLQKLTVDVVFKQLDQENQANLTNGQQSNSTQGEAGNNSSVAQFNATFPVEAVAFMARLQELELYLYEQVNGFSIDSKTPVPLPVSKTLERLVLSCRYCNNISLNAVGKLLPNLHHLVIAAPLQQTVLTEQALKQFTKLEELVIYDGNLRGVNGSVFQATPSLKQLSIKYAPITEMNQENMQGLENKLESLAIVGTPIRQVNVSSFKNLNFLDISQNRLSTINRNMLPEKAQFSELNISYNPIKRVENGFLSGVELKNHVLNMNGWEVESFDLNAVEGVENVQVVDITKNLKLKNVQVSNYKNLPSNLQRIIVGRSPYLRLEDQNGQFAKMLTEQNITMVIEGHVACCCQMNWIAQLQKEQPHLIEIESSRAVCSSQGTNATLLNAISKLPTVANFFKVMNDEKVGICKNAGKQ